MGEKQEITTTDLYKLIQDLVVKSDEIQQQNKTAKDELKQEIRNIKEVISCELEEIKEENKRLAKENKALKERLITTEKKLKKYNLIFYGLEERDSEIDDIENFLNIVNNKLQINCRFTDIRDFHRLGRVTQNKVRPVIVEFINYKLKVEILQNSKKLKGTGIYVANDYVTEDYEKQKLLRTHFKLAREKKQEAKIKNNTLYINGEKFTYEDLKGKEIDQTEDEPPYEEEKQQLDTIQQKTPKVVDRELAKKRKLEQFTEKENPMKRVTRPKTK